MTLQQALAVMLYYRDHPVNAAWNQNISGKARDIVYFEAQRAIMETSAGLLQAKVEGK